MPGHAAQKKTPKTYNSGDSPVVTHLTTNPPIHWLTRAERTGSRAFSVLWSYVKEIAGKEFIIGRYFAHQAVSLCYTALESISNSNMKKWAML